MLIIECPNICSSGRLTINVWVFGQLLFLSVLPERRKTKTKTNRKMKRADYVNLPSIRWHKAHSASTMHRLLIQHTKKCFQQDGAVLPEGHWTLDGISLKVAEV